MATLDQTGAAAPPPPASPAAGPSSLLLTIIAVATGALVANLYYAQPLIAFIGPELGIPRSLAGALVSVTQLGYGIGLFLIVSLADIVENKRLVMITLAAVVMALVAAALSHSAVLFFLASLVIGISSTGAQVLVPFASHLVPPERRGRTVGNIMAGLLTGILLARPLALFVAAAVGWRPVFWLSAGVMLVIGGLLLRIMPRYVPRGGLSYGRVLLSMVGLVRSTAGAAPARRLSGAGVCRLQPVLDGGAADAGAALPAQPARHRAVRAGRRRRGAGGHRPDGWPIAAMANGARPGRWRR